MSIYKKWSPKDKETMMAIIKINGMKNGVKLASQTFNVSEGAIRAQNNLITNFIKVNKK